MPANVETLAYVADRGVPWHGLGTAVPGLMTAQEALVAAGLDWEVGLEPVSVASSGIVIPDRYATVRSTDGKPLGIVGNRFRPLQNKDAFDWADALVDDGQAKYETAGSLRDGAWVFMSMELDHLEIRVPGDESPMKTYLFVINGHDGSRATEAHVCHVRVVCTNTAEMARRGAVSSFKVRHSGNIEGKIEQARTALGITFQNAEMVQAVAATLAKTKMRDKAVDELYRKVWPAPPEAQKAGEPSRNAERAYENYLTSDTLVDIRGTGWGAFNGITEFLDHLTVYRAKTYAPADVRADMLLFGSSAEIKDKALDLLLAGAARG